MTRVHVVLLISLIGCSTDPISPGLEELTGSWTAEAEALSPQGSMQDRLVFHSDGHMEFRVQEQGIYQGQTPEQLSYRYVYYGRVRVNANDFATSPDSSVTEDRFYGPTSHIVQRQFGNSPGWPAGATLYHVTDNTLILDYYSYPADGPVLTQMVLHRD